MLRCDGCGASATAGYDGFCHGADCGVTPSGNWRAQPGHVYVAGAHNFQQQAAESAMQNYLARESQGVASQNQDFNQIQQMPSAMLIRPDDVAKWELFNAGAIDLAVQTELQGELKSRLDLAGENQRLKMELADETGAKDFCVREKLKAQEELAWAKREITRLDPRLARARWGK